MFVFKKLLKTDFAKSVAWMTGGTAFIQALSIIFSPILTRIYTPEEFGIFALYSSFLGVLMIIGTLRYENAVPLANNDRSAMNTLVLSFFLLTSMSIFCWLLFFVFGETILNYFDAEKLIPYRFLLPLGMFFSGLYLILAQWALRQKNFKTITKTKINQGISMNLLKVLLGFFKFGAFGLILGNISGKSAGVLTLLRFLWQNNAKELKSVTLKRMVWAAKRYRKFPTLTMPSQFLSNAAMELPVFFITVLYSAQIVGQYALAHMIVSLPVALIGAAVGDVFYAESASKKNNPKELLRISNKILKPLFLLGILPMIVLAIFSPWLFTFIFGEKWLMAGEFAQIIVGVAFVRLLFTPIFWVFLVFEKHGMYLFVTAMRVSGVILAFLAASFFEFTTHQAIMIYTVIMVVIYCTTYLLARKQMLLAIREKHSA